MRLTTLQTVAAHLNTQLTRAQLNPAGTTLTFLLQPQGGLLIQVNARWCKQPPPWLTVPASLSRAEWAALAQPDEATREALVAQLKGYGWVAAFTGYKAPVATP